MKVIFLIFALLMVASCDEMNDCQGSDVTKSPANPIEFWPVDCDTYNQKEVCGIHPKCFCAPWNCDDRIVDQGTDTTDDDYRLTLFDEDDNELYSEIYNRTTINIAASADDLSEGSNYGAGDLTWSLGSNPSVTGLTTGLITKKYRVPIIDGVFGESINFTVNLDFNNLGGSGGTFNTTPLFYLFNSLMNESVQIGGGDIGGVYVSAGNKIETHSLTPDFIPAYLVMTFEYTGGGGFTMGIDINSVVLNTTPNYRSTYNLSFVPSEVGICDERVRAEITNVTSSPDVVEFHSDCLDIRENHPCTNLIEYSNNNDLVGLVYENVSPAQTFFIRVPSVFFHEEFPEEEEVMELVSSVEVLNSQLMTKRKMSIDYVPYYFHKKLKLIFKHQFVLIDSKYWTRVDEYSILEGNRMWPIKMGEVLLTDKDSVIRAVLGG